MNTRRQLISFLLALFMVLGTITPLFAENDSVTVLPPRMADETKEPEDNIVILNGGREEKEETKDSPIILENNRGELNVEEKEADKDTPVILENRDDNNVTILPPITNEEKTTEPEPKEEQKKEEEESKAPVEVQVLSKRETTDGDKKEEGKVSLVLLNDKPASVNEEVYSKIKWIKDDFSIDNDKILGLSEEGLKKVKANKKLVIPEIENVTTIEKQAFMNLGLRVVEIPNSITLIEEEAFKDNGLTKVVINGKGKTIAESAFGGDLLNEYKKNEEEVFLYEFEGLEIGEEIKPEAVGASEPDDLSFFTFDGTTITGLTDRGKAYYKENHTMILPATNNEYQLITEIGDEAFCESNPNGSILGLGLMYIDLTNCRGLKRIGKMAFFHNEIKNIYLSECPKLEVIDDFAFSINHISHLSLENNKNLKHIGEGAFYANKFNYILDLSKCTGLESIGKRAFYSNQIQVLLLNGCENLKTINNEAFRANQINYTDFSKCFNLEEIGVNAFEDNDISLIDLKDSKRLRRIAENAFVDNTGDAEFSNLVVIVVDSEIENNFNSTNNYIVNPKEVASTEFNENDFIYKLNQDDSYSIAGFSNKGKIKNLYNHYNVNISCNSYQGKPITSIEDNAFSLEETKLNSLNLSGLSHLKAIGISAFMDTGLKTVDFSGCKNLSEIKENAFGGNKIKEIDLTGCVNLVNIGDYAFSYNNISDINNVKWANDEKVENFSEGLFAYNPLKRLDLTKFKNLKNISDYAFSGCKLTHAQIPLSVESIGGNAFEDNKNDNPGQKVFVVTPNNENPNNLQDSEYHLINPDLSQLNGDELCLFTFKEYKEIVKTSHTGSRYWVEEQLLTRLIITGLTDLGKIYYKDHHNLIIPDEDVDYNSVTKIAMNAFEGLGLESVDFSNSTSIETIEPGAFRNNNLSELDLESISYLNTIGTLAFAENKLKSAKFPWGVKNLAYDAFKDNIGSNAEKQVFIETDNYYKLPDTEYHIFRDPYDETPVLASDNLDFFTFDGTTITGLTDLGKENYKNNPTMVLPGVNKEGKRITAIGDNAFSGIGALSINFGKIDSLTKIGKNAFSNNNIDNIDLRPLKDLTLIDDEAFSNSKINHISLDNLKKLEKIGKRAFADNNIQNTYLDLRSNYSLNTVDEEAFKNNKLTIAKIPLNLLTLLSNAFEGNTGFKDVKVYVYTADGTNPKNLQNSDYHLINPKMEESNSSLFKYEETEDGVTLLGLSNIGEIFVKQNPDKEIVIPSKTDTGANITQIADNAFNEKNLNLTFEENTNLTYIGDHAFFKNKIKTLDLNKFPNVSTISPYAFAHNEIKDLTISDTLTTIGKYAFRDNEIEKLDTKNVKTIEEGAFSNNNLRELILGTAIEVIKDYAFKQNDLTSVEIPKAIKEFGKMVFTFNNRYVRVKTESDIVKTEKVGRAFGHVVNSVVITVRFIDKETKKKLIEDKIYGDDFTDINAGIIEGEENLYNPEEIKGYLAPDEIKYTPVGDNYVLTVEYVSLKTKPVIDSTKVRMINLNEAVDENMLKSFIKVTDLTGKDISEKVEVTPKTIDTTSGGLKKVTYKVTDEYGNTAIKEVEIPVAIDWNDYPIGGGWVLGDFTYNVSMNSVTGFSEQGQEKVRTNKNLVVPGVIPVDGVDSYEKLPKTQEISSFAFSKNRLTGVNFSNCVNLVEIGRETFVDNNITDLDLSMCTNLMYINNGTFRNNQITNVDLSGCENLIFIREMAFSDNQISNLNLSECRNLESIGYFSFARNQITSLDLSDCKNLMSINGGAFYGNNIFYINLLGCENLKIIKDFAFQDNKIQSLDLSNCHNLVSIGKNAFKENRISSLNLSNCEKLETIEEGAFYGDAFNEGRNLITDVNFKNCSSLKTIGKDAFFHAKIESLDLSDCISLEVIGDSAFTRNNIKTLDFSNCKNLKSIESYAFEANKIESINFSNCTSLNTIGERTFSNNKIKNLNFTNCSSLETIGTNTFGFNNLEILDFSGCSNLETIKMGAFSENQIKTINFSGCTNLKNIESQAFHTNKIQSIDLLNCKSLKILDSPFIKNPGNPKYYNLVDIWVDSSLENFFPSRSNYIINPKKYLDEDSDNFNENDFSYEKDEDGTFTITGLSSSGRVKLMNNGYNLKIPFGFYKNTPVTSINYNAFNSSSGIIIKSLDLSGCTNLETIGYEAFYENKIETLNLSGCKNLKNIIGNAFYRNNIEYINFSGCQNLVNIGNGAFKGNKITSLNMSDCVNLESIGNYAFEDNQITNIDFSNMSKLENIGDTAFSENNIEKVYIPLSLKKVGSKAFYKNKGVNFNGEVALFTFDGSNPNNLLNDSYSHIINPLYFGINYITEDGQLLSYVPTKEYSGGSTITLPEYFGYIPSKIQETEEKLSSNKWIINLNNKNYETINVVYEKLNIDTLNGLSLNLSMKKNNSGSPYNYYIGSEQRLNIKINVKEDIPNIENSTIVIQLPPYIDKDSIKIPSHINIKSKEFENDTLKINLQNITRNTSLDIPMLFNLKKNETPENTEINISGTILNGDKNTIHEIIGVNFTGYYNRPALYITAETSNGFESYYRWEDGPRAVGEIGRGMFEDKSKKMVITPYDFKFGFMFSNGENSLLERNVENYELSIDLPEYTAYDGNGNEVIKQAIFKQELNKNWIIDESLGKKRLIYNKDVDNNTNVSFPELYLSFPNAKDMGEVNLNSNIKLTPTNKGKNENIIKSSDNLTIYTTGKRILYVNSVEASLFLYPSNVRSNSEVRQFIYDSNKDREKVVKWVAGFTRNKKQKDYKDLVMHIDKFDSRYKVTSIENNVNEKLKFKLYLNGSLVEEFELLNEGDKKEVSKKFDKLEIEAEKLLNNDLEFFINTLALDKNISLGKENVSMTMTGTTSSKSIVDEKATTVYQMKAWSYYQILPFDYKLNAKIAQSVSSGKTAVSGDTVKYNVGLVDYVAGVPLNNGEFFTKNLDDFVMIHVLPKNAQITDIKLSDKFKNSEESTYKIVELDNGCNAIIFKTKSLLKGTYNIADISIYASSNMGRGKHPSFAYATWTGDGAEKYKVETIPENLKPYLNGEVTKDNVSFSLEVVQSVFSEKYIKTDKGLTLSSVTENGDIDYVLKVANITDTERKDVEIIDILPYDGDSRNSTLDVILRETITLDGAEILYTTAEHPDFNSTFTNIYSDNVTGIKIKIPKIEKNETLNIKVKAKVKDMPQTKEEMLNIAGKIAVNDFWRVDDLTKTPVKTNSVKTTYKTPVGKIKFVKYGLKKSLFGSNYKKKPLQGAIFELRDIDGRYIDKAISDNDGLVVFNDVDVKNYIIKEVKPPKGYEKAEDFRISKEDFKLLNNEFIAEFNIDIINENVRKGNLTIKKTTMNGIPLKNIEFTIKGISSFNSNFEKTVETNNNGLIYISSIPEGEYRVYENQEDKNSIHFITAPSQTFKIEQTPGDDASEDQEITLNFINDKVEFRVYKIGYGEDEKFPENIANTKTFNRPKLSNVKFEVTVNGVIETYTTNSEGYIKIESPTNTTVKIKEVKGDPRFQVYNKEITLKITDDGKIEGFPTGTVYIPNIRKKLVSEVEIVKVNDDGDTLRGEEISLYKDDKFVESKTSTIENSKFTIKNPGTYTIKETKAPAGYHNSGRKSTFTIVDNIMNVDIIEENSPEYNKKINYYEYEMYVATDTEIKFMKKIELTNYKVEVTATKYERVLNNITEEEANKYKEDPNYSVIPNGQFYNVVHPLKGAEFDLFEGDKVIKKLVSDDKGNLDMSDILWDEEKVYSLKETKTPSSQYQLLKKPIMINFEMLKRDPNFNGVVNINIENKTYKGKIIISKYRNDENEIMEGQEFTLYKDSVSEENKLMTKATDKSGLIEFSDLELGHYIVKETKVDEGWALSKDEYVSDLTVESPVSVHKIFNTAKTIKFTVKKVDEKGNPMEGVLFALYNAKSPDLPETPGPKQKIEDMYGKEEVDFNYYEDYKEFIVGNNNKNKETNPIEDNNSNGLNIAENAKTETFGLEISNDGPDKKVPVGQYDDEPGGAGRDQMSEYVEPQQMNVAFVIASGRYGIINFEIPYGNYILREVKTKDGYVLSQKTHLITPESEGKVYEYVNYPIEIPKTGTLGSLPYIGVGLLLVAGAYIVLKKKEEEARD